MRGFALLLIVFFIVSGCATIRYSPHPDSEGRPHPLGMMVYNLSGEEMSEGQWELRFLIVSAAYSSLKECVGDLGPEAEVRIRQTPIVITPAERLFVLWIEGLAWMDLHKVLVRRDRLDSSDLRAEWLHLYLWATGKRFLGDPLHRDPLFQKCSYVPGEL